MEIRNEGKLDESKVKDDTVINSKSLLAKQINDMIIWLNLNLDTSMTLKRIQPAECHSNRYLQRLWDY